MKLCIQKLFLLRKNVYVFLKKRRQSLFIVINNDYIYTIKISTIIHFKHFISWLSNLQQTIRHYFTTLIPTPSRL